MIRTTVTTPVTTYQLQLQQQHNQVSFGIMASATNLTATTFQLNVNDADIAHYFVNYLGTILAMTFQRKMSDSNFLSQLQKLITLELKNWQSGYQY
ncbi:hypothetical protein [Weissella hellenica]|uniref:hypothetical protein n=1 Tax=Weissella hellenica TaxID=46256 RepID=UPI003886E07D